MGKLIKEFREIPFWPKFVALFFLVLPIIIRLQFPDLIAERILQNELWKVHFISATIFAYYLGIKGGLMTAAFTIVSSITVEVQKLNINPERYSSFIAHLYVEVVTTLLLAFVVGMLAQRLKEKQAKLDEANRKLADLAVVEERNRIARELHDGLAQTLGYLNFKVLEIEKETDSASTKKELQDIQEIIDEAYNDLRQNIFGLKQELQKGFCNVLKEYTDKYEKDNKVKINLRLPESAENHIPFKVKVQLIRIIQEALVNIRKHANAATADINIFIEEGKLHLEIEDDGCGFLVESAVKDKNKFGVSIMQQRTELINGDFKITSELDKGTKINVKVNLGGNKGEEDQGLVS